MSTYIFQSQVLHLHHKNFTYLNTQYHIQIKETKKIYNIEDAYLQGTSPNSQSSDGTVHGLFPYTKSKYFPHYQLEDWGENPDLEKWITWDQALIFKNDGHINIWYHEKKKTPWSESASELYRPSDRRFSAKCCQLVRIEGATWSAW
jgi:hypothetical protein